MARFDEPRGVARDLARCLASRELAQIRRRVPQADELEGFVTGLGTECVALALLDPAIFVNGFAAVPLRDVASVDSRANGSFVQRAEAVDPEVCYIGRVTEVTDETVVLLQIDTAATWDDELTVWALQDVTRVEWGGRYERALFAVGGEPEPA